MKPTLHLMLAVALTSSSLGCRICADCEPFAYPAYGGAWERLERSSGRVGSIFAPAGAKVPELVERDQPPSRAELERAQEDVYGPTPQVPFDFDEEAPTPEELERDKERRRQELERLELDDLGSPAAA